MCIAKDIRINAPSARGDNGADPKLQRFPVADRTARRRRFKAVRKAKDPTGNPGDSHASNR